MRSPTISRWYWLLRSHRPSQLLWRAWRLIERKLPMSYWRRKCRGGGSPAVRADAADLKTFVSTQRQNHTSLAETRGDGGVSLMFLGLSRTMALPVDWRCETIESVPHLWRFHLHDQQWLRDLPPEARWKWVLDWIEANRLTDRRELSDAWHPFCISRRVVAWMLLWVESPPSEQQDVILASLARQVMFLSRHLEWDLRGNHLLFNLWALGIAAAFFDGPVGDRALAVVRRHLPSQLKEQILPSGEHFERSPMYHAEMLEVVTDLTVAMVLVGSEAGVSCSTGDADMDRALRAILHPDGEIPLLGDSAFDGVPVSAYKLGMGGLRDNAKERFVESLKHGDYWTFTSSTAPLDGISEDFRNFIARRFGGDFLLFDTGPVGADELPAHAHCDLLGLEASIGGKRFLVDSGVFDYEDSEMRMFCRSTFAHNVLQIDDVDQCDVWSRFRMGYRGWPMSANHGMTADGFHWCRATHNAYRRIGVREVGRLVACREDGLWMIVDWTGRSRGQHRLTSRLHLHPDTVIGHVDDRSARVTVAERTLLITGHGPGRLVLEQGWYCPRFGERHENTILSWRTDNIHLPAAIGWLIQPVSTTPAALEIDAAPPVRVIVHHQGRSHAI